MCQGCSASVEHEWPVKSGGLILLQTYKKNVVAYIQVMWASINLCAYFILTEYLVFKWEYNMQRAWALGTFTASSSSFHYWAWDACVRAVHFGSNHHHTWAEQQEDFYLKSRKLCISYTALPLRRQKTANLLPQKNINVEFHRLKA